MHSVRSAHRARHATRDASSCCVVDLDVNPRSIAEYDADARVAARVCRVGCGHDARSDPSAEHTTVPRVGDSRPISVSELAMHMSSRYEHGYEERTPLTASPCSPFPPRPAHCPHMSGAPGGRWARGASSLVSAGPASSGHGYRYRYEHVHRRARRRRFAIKLP